MTNKVNQKAMDFIQKEFIQQIHKSSGTRPMLRHDTIKKLGINTEDKKIEIGNLLLKQDLLLSNDYSVNLIDSSRDLNGEAIKDNSKLLARIQKNWEQGESMITYEDMWKLKIWTPDSTIFIGNFKLFSGMLGGNYYTISIVDEEKDIYGRWIDSVVDHKKIVKVLDEYKYDKKQLLSFKETDLNAALEKHFRKYFDSANKSSGNLKGIFDLEIGNLKYVIEIKLSSAAKKTDQRDRAYGQMKRYLEEFQSKNYMLIVAGDPEDKQNDNIKALKHAAEKDFGVHYYFMTTEK